MGNDVAEFDDAQVGVQRNDRYAQRVQGEPVEKEGGTVFQQQADAMAGAVASFGVPGAEVQDGVQRFGVGDVAGFDAVGGGGFRM